MNADPSIKTELKTNIFFTVNCVITMTLSFFVFFLFFFSTSYMYVHLL